MFTLIYIHILTACRNFASSKEMTADATLEALEGTGFRGLNLSEWRFNRLLRAVGLLYILFALWYSAIAIYIYTYKYTSMNMTISMFAYFCIPIYKTTFGQHFVVCFSAFWQCSWMDGRDVNRNANIPANIASISIYEH